MSAEIIARLPTLGERVDAINRLLDRMVELEAEVDRLTAWLIAIEGGDNPCTNAMTLRQWAYEAITLGKDATFELQNIEKSEFKSIENLVWRIAPDRSAHIFERCKEEWSLCGAVTPDTKSHWVRIARSDRHLRCYNCEHQLSRLVP